MNPPFTRLTGGGGKTSEIPLPMFAAFGTVKEEQELMSQRTKKLTQETCAHGNAGEASIFLQIAHNKVRDGGHIALVLPLTFLSGSPWEDCRELIRKNYNDIVVATIASSKSGSFAFSADTDVGECLLVARKSGKPATRLTSVSLITKPSAPFEGTEIARLIREKIRDGKVAILEGGPLGGTPVDLGNVRIGEMLSGPLSPGQQWPLFRIADHTIAQVVYQLVAQKTLWLPGMAKSAAQAITLCKLEELGEIGPYHLDINGSGISGGAPRGPFEIKDIPSGHAATYPILASHDAERERTLEVDHDAAGIPRVGKTKQETEVLERRRDHIWATKSRLHVNTDFRFNSQSLVFSFTAEPSLGGRAWPTFKMKNPAYDIIALLWGADSGARPPTSPFGRLAEEGGEVLDPLHVVVLGFRRELADRHVFDHAPAQLTDNLVGHGDAPVLSEVGRPSSSRKDAPSRYRVARAAAAAHSRASGLVP